MRQAKRWRYYCDFCKKVSGRRSAMERHEKGCTMNPNRVCGVGDKWKGGCVATVPELLAELAEKGYPALRNLAEECPACILAALRQSTAIISDQDASDGRYDFDYKKEMENVWRDVNEERWDGVGRCYE